MEVFDTPREIQNIERIGIQWTLREFYEAVAVIGRYFNENGGLPGCDCVILLLMGVNNAFYEIFDRIPLKEEIEIIGQLLVDGNLGKVMKRHTEYYFDV